MLYWQKSLRKRAGKKLCAEYVHKIQKALAANEFHMDWIANAHAAMLTFWNAVDDKESIQRWIRFCACINPLKPATTLPSVQRATGHGFASIVGVQRSAENS